MKIRTTKRKTRPTAPDKVQRQHDAERLRNHCAKRRAGRPHRQPAHKQIVQRNIADTGRRDEIHGMSGIAQTAKYRRNHIVCGNERHAEKTDQQIPLRFRGSFGRRLHQSDNPSAGHPSGCRQQQRDQQEYHHRRTGRRLDARPLSGADELSRHYGRSHGQPDEHDGQHVHHLTAYRYRRDPRRTLKLADDEKVRHAIKRLQKIGKKIGQRKRPHRAQNTAARQIVHENASIPVKGRGPASSSRFAGRIHLPVPR